MKKRRRLHVVAGLVLLALAALSPDASAQYWQSAYVCSASTQCFWGPISCYVQGNASTGTACQWYVVPNMAVGCLGFDGYGNWQKYEFHC